MYLNHQRRSTEITSLTYPEIRFSTDVQLKKDRKGCQLQSAVQNPSTAFLPASQNTYTQFLNNNCGGLREELEMANRVSGPRSHYSLNTLRIMKTGPGGKRGDGKSVLLECTEPLHISVWTHNTAAMWQMIANTAWAAQRLSAAEKLKRKCVCFSSTWWKSWSLSFKFRLLDWYHKLNCCCKCK